jgi:hypothetical protein
MSFLLYRTRECLTSLPYTTSWRAEGQLQDIFARLKCWRFKYQVDLCRSPLSAKKITFRKREKVKHHVFRCWRLHTKVPFPSRCSFWHAIERPVRYLRRGHKYVVIYLPFSQYPRLFRSARFRMWTHTKSEKSSQDAIILAVGNLDSRIWRHPT